MKELLSFFIILTSPISLIIVWVALPMMAFKYTEINPEYVYGIGTIIWVLFMIFAVLNDRTVKEMDERYRK